ncbi:MAG: TlpA family protein disulfide reductase [Flavobacteriales bacterium]
MKIPYLILIVFTLSLLGSCNDSTDVQGNPINLWIKGTIKGAEGMTLFVEAPSEDGMISLFSGEVDEQGNIELEGNIAGLGFYQLRLGDNKENAIPISPLPKDRLTINTSLNEFALKPNLSGASWTKTMNAYMAKQATFRAEQMKLMANQGQLTEQEYAKRIIRLKTPLLRFAQQEIDKKPANPYHIILSMELFPMTGFEGWDESNLKSFKKVSEAFASTYGVCPASSALEAQYNQLESGYLQYKQLENGELTAPNFALLDLNGKAVKLTDFRGDLVLIDFWASWCGPCRQESPNMVKLYNTFKNKNFTILSVSMDEDPVKWKEAIQYDGLVWKTHVSDLRGWTSGMPQLYGFDGIPFTVLVNPEGKIIAKGLRGAALFQKIESYYVKNL